MASRSKKKQMQREIDIKNEEKEEKKESKLQEAKSWFAKNAGPLITLVVVVAFVVFASVGIVRSFNTPSYSHYNQIIEDNPTLIKIGSVDCPVCRSIEPDIISLAQQYDGEINMEFYDAWNSREGRSMANNYNAEALPTLIYLDENGVEVSRLEGANDKSTIENLFFQNGWVLND